jgi:3-oxoadipate enol-lactonase
MSFARINGADLFYAESGDGAPIIFGHGLTGSHYVWEPVTRRLQDRFRCILTDFRGAGDSNQAKGPCTIAQFADDIVALADHLALATFTYVGLSLGGVVGMQLGVACPDRLEKLILVAPAPWGRKTAIDVPERQRRLAKTGNEELIGNIVRAGLARDVSEEGEEYLRSRARTFLTTSQEHLDIAHGLEQDLSPALARVQIPTLVVAGAADFLLQSNLADFARLPNATLHVFSRVGHVVPIDVPDALAELVVDFMEHGVVDATTIQSRVAAASQVSV